MWERIRLVKFEPLLFCFYTSQSGLKCMNERLNDNLYPLGDCILFNETNRTKGGMLLSYNYYHESN